MNKKLNQFTIHNSQLTKYAFTLAETLIVMGIIGVVAALTLPNLNSSTGDKEKVTKVKKIYSNLNDAYGRAQTVYGSSNEWNTTQKWGRLTEFLKISKDCGCSNSANCFKCKNATGSIKLNNDTCSAVLADGTSILMTPSDTTNNAIYIDIDGINKGQNTIAKDIFGFKMAGVDGILPYGHSEIFNGSFNTCDCTGSNLTLLCTEFVVMFDNMDYAQTNANGKCPNNNTILDYKTNTTCK
ncbi:type II secretion system protein [bacterium]|nr:type II secretion system protein [bacterium]